MTRIDRIPSIPLIASDPYFSIWMPADDFTSADTVHWAGFEKPVRASLSVNGETARLIGTGNAPAAQLDALEVLPTRTVFAESFSGVTVETCFATPALPDDFDLLSMPVTLATFRLTSESEKDVAFTLSLSDKLCYHGTERPRLYKNVHALAGMNDAMLGKMQQTPLNHSGDLITIDWGYLHLMSAANVEATDDGLTLSWSGRLAGSVEIRALIAYDDIASINYFGVFANAWYRRNGATISDALARCARDFDSILAACEATDRRVIADASAISEDYRLIACAAWRQVFAAHKLIATPKGEMALLSKENNSNGCIGTVDVSYPSIPMLLKYCPELVNALCRPVLEFASMPVWIYDFAPHDVGRYPYATGQVYAARSRAQTKPGEIFPPYYLYPADADDYQDRLQMPVEESANMLIMLEAAREYDADAALANQYRNLLDKWVRYLVEYGEDPGEQLCTDDFAGHLAHNVNLAAKAIVGVACYARLVNDPAWTERAREMMRRLLSKIGASGDTPLTLDGSGWSMKYNLLWDRVLKLGLVPDEFYANETRSYLKRINKYGLPLDSRETYTKSDWICWCAAMADDADMRDALIAPIARMLRESHSRVPFTDWYDTRSGSCVQFRARSVQGGLFAPMLTAK